MAQFAQTPNDRDASEAASRSISELARSDFLTSCCTCSLRPPFLTCLAIISAILFACMASLDRDASYLIYAVIGPAKVMLLRASMNSKVYRGVHTIFHLRTFEWSEFTEVEFDHKQKLVGLKFAWYDNYLNIIKISTAPLYARRREFDTILAFLEKQVPELPRSLQSVERA